MRRVSHRWFKLFCVLIVSLFLSVLACSAESNVATNGGDPYTMTGGSESGGGESGSTGTTFQPVAGSAGYTGTSTSGSGYDRSALGTGGTVSFDEEDICAGTRVDPIPIEIQVPIEVPYEVMEPAPIAIYIMLDKSSSMNEMSGGSTKWATVLSSIDAFLKDPDSEFLDVGLQYFPILGGACDGSGYETPAVPVGTLPGNAAAISNSLSTAQVGNPLMTPIEGALRGMTAFCAQFQAQHPEEECVGVLISDGAPTECAIEPNVLISISQNAYDNSKVKTFTVGMQGAVFDLLNQVAMWGGTDCTPANTSDGYACDVSSGMTLIQAFEAIRKVVTKLETRTEMRIEIENKIAECEWGLPDTPEAVGGEGEEFNKDKVNVIFYDPNIGEDPIKKIPIGTNCNEVPGGWYYDNEANPTKIIACPQTCDLITSVEGASIDIQLGCDTKVLIK